MVKPKRINLALQGGGAHGAFTWGVLDRLLEVPEVEIAAISGTSAGAMNGAALKAGLITGGRAGAREKLDWFWDQMGGAAAQWAGWGQSSASAVSRMIEYSLPFQAADAASRMMSPYAYGPFYSNPLEPIAKALNYDLICADRGPELFVSATNVRSGKVRVFRTAEITAEVLMASACLPTLFQAVELVDPATGQTEAFWDGGYMGNPALFPLFHKDLPDDIAVININPLYRPDIPKTPQDIQNRINEISFNSSLLRELRAINFVKRLLSTGDIDQSSMKNVLVHMIADDDLMTSLSVATKMVPNPVVMAELKAAGRIAAGRFIDDHLDKVGVESTVNLEDMFGDGSPGF